MKSKRLSDIGEIGPHFVFKEKMDDVLDKPCEPDGLSQGATVTARTPEGSGEWVRVTVCVRGDFPPFDSSAGAKRKTHSVRVLTSLYGELGIRIGENLSEERAEALLTASQVSQAIVCGEASLSYGDRSARRLTQKLMAKGFSVTVAADAVAYLKQQGYLQEQSAALRQAEQDVKKLWGLTRIRNDLFAKGFEKQEIERALDALAESDVDFVANCQTVIQKKYGGVPADAKERQSMKAALARMGYSAGEMREAMERVLHDDGL